MQFKATEKLPIKNEVLVVFTGEKPSKSKGSSESIHVFSDDKRTSDLVATLVKQGDYGKAAPMLYLPYLGSLGSPSSTKSESGRLLLVHLKAKEANDNEAHWGANAFRELGNNMLGAAKTTDSLHINLLDLDPIAKHYDVEPFEVVRGLAEGLALGGYSFDKHKTLETASKTSKTSNKKLKTVHVVTRLKGAKTLLQEVMWTTEGTIRARDWSNEPSNHLGTKSFSADLAKQARLFGVQFSSMKKPELKKRKMGGLLAVNAGSAEGAELITLRHTPKSRSSKTKTILLVGKGVMFDSGGISIKPGLGMGEMKMDMAGAAAVASIVLSASKMNIRHNVVGLIPATDNKIDAHSMSPGDVITMHSGQTVEVDNTDAEGRLILADALSYGLKQFKPDMAIDFATLTGAAVVALGHRAAALFTNPSAEQQGWKEKLLEASLSTDERIWPLPLYPSYKEQLKSEVADINNIGTGRDAGTITAAKFLESFVDAKVPWAHIDIAGTAMLSKPFSFHPKGGTGFGVRLVLDMLQRL